MATTVRPQYVLGTEAFFTAFEDRSSPAHTWLFGDARSFHQRGIIISCVTPLICHRTLASVASHGRYHQLHRALSHLTDVFGRCGCIWPVGHQHLRYAENYLAGDIIYRRRDGVLQPISDFEKWVLATALVGFPVGNPIVLRDYPQAVHSKIANLRFQSL